MPSLVIRNYLWQLGDSKKRSCASLYDTEAINMERVAPNTPLDVVPYKALSHDERLH
jgi:hypothetical protein